MLTKTKNFFNENKYVLCSGGGALFIILLVYFCYEIIPFGDTTVYRMDLYHQYGPLFSELYDRLTSGSSLIYSWNTGLGSSFLGNYYNYLSSPISFIILFFGHENTFEAIGAMIAIKCTLSAMSVSYYLKKSQKTNDLSITAFGILYAFCGYFIAYYWNVMWIDSLYILPFVVLGIEKIIDTGNVKTYLFSLMFAIFSNYYIGFMVCIFSCLYFIYYFVCSAQGLKARKENLNNNGLVNKIKNSFFLNSGFRFAFTSLSVGILLLFMLLPLAFVLRSSSATTGVAPTETKYYFAIFDFLANHLASLEPTIRSSGNDVLPNIYCGVLTVMLIPLYLFSKKITSIEKTASIVLLAIMYFSFNLNILNFAWHGFHFPNDLPYRQSFMYSFILIVLAFKAFKNIGEYTKKQILSVGISVIAFILLTQKLGSKNVGDETVYISIIFVFIYTVVLGLIVSKKNQAFALSVLLTCSVAAESIVANTDHYVANQTKASYTSDYDAFKDIQSTVRLEDKSLFYREELAHLRARMDPSWYGYNGASVFSSMAYEKVSNLQKYIGMFGNKINSFTYNPQTPVYNAMFSLKYVYDKGNYISDCKFYDEIAVNETYTAYKNNYMLNIAYPVSSDVEYWDAKSLKNPVEVQEEYFRLTTGVSNVFTHIYDYEVIYGNILSLNEESKYSECLSLNKIDTAYHGAATVSITAKNEENIYIYVNSRNLDTVSIYSPNITTSMSVADGYILDLGVHQPGEIISVELPIKDSLDYATVDFAAFTVNQENFIKGYNKLKDGQLEYTRFGDTLIQGKFTAETDEVLYTSIPFDEGWNVYIDGKKVNKEDLIKISDALLGVRVTEGEHEITFSYNAVMLSETIIISSVFAIFLLIIYILKSRKLFIFKKDRLTLWKKAPKVEKSIVEEIKSVIDDEISKSDE